MKTSTLKKLILISIILIASLLFTIPSYAADTDVIKNYEINISPRKNGTLLLTYTIDWKVLDSSSVGPLTDLYVGIPNKNVTDIKKLSNNIKTIYYTDKSYNTSGHFMYMDLSEDYFTGDVAKIKFSFVISHMYELDNVNCIYEFTPGWFNEVKVENFKATCKAKGVTSHNATSTLNNQLVWETSFNKGETTTIEIQYPKSAFTVLDEMKQKTHTDTFIYDPYAFTQFSTEENYDTGYSFDMSSAYITAFCFIFFIAFIAIVSNSNPKDYYNHSGYGYRTRSSNYDFYDDDYYDDDEYMRSRYHTRTSRHRRTRPNYSIYSSRSRSSWSDSSSSWSDSSSSSSSSSISSCACACACAGGGRAGCSKKELYHFNSKDLKKVLKK